MLHLRKKKRRNITQKRTVYSSTVYSTIYRTVSVQSTVQLTKQSTVQSSDTYVYGVGMLAVFAIGVCVFFAYNNFPKNKKANGKHDQPPKRRLCFRSDDEKSLCNK